MGGERTNGIMVKHVDRVLKDMNVARDPEPEPDPPEPGPDDEPDTMDQRVTAIFTSQVALIERVERLEDRMTKLEERVAAPPVGIGRRP